MDGVLLRTEKSISDSLPATGISSRGFILDVHLNPATIDNISNQSETTVQALGTFSGELCVHNLC